MKLCHKKMVLQFMLEGLRPCTILCFNVHTTVEYLNKNISIGQLLLHIPNSIVVCAGSRPKRQTKTYRFHNHCLQLTMVKYDGIIYHNDGWFLEIDSQNRDK